MLSPSRRTAALTALALALGCSIHVETPQVTARELQFTGVDGGGITFQVQFAAYNPNTFDLPLRELDAHLYLAGNDVGSAVSAIDQNLPARGQVNLSATVRVPWNGMPAYLMALSAPTVPWRMEGEVTVQHYLSVRAPFVMEGAVGRDFFLRGAANSVGGIINSVLPGLGVQMQ